MTHERDSSKKLEGIKDSMDSVSAALLIAEKHDLQTEVVTWALIAMQNDPTLNLSEAIEIGFNEWIK